MGFRLGTYADPRLRATARGRDHRCEMRSSALASPGSQSSRVILYMTRSRPDLVSDPASFQPARWKTVRIATFAGSVGASMTSAAARSKSQFVRSASASRP